MVRIMMSALTANSRFERAAAEQGRREQAPPVDAAPGDRPARPRVRSIRHRRVPSPTPRAPRWKCQTNSRSSAMLTRFITICSTSAARVRPRPNSQPLIANTRQAGRRPEEARADIAMRRRIERPAARHRLERQRDQHDLEREQRDAQREPSHDAAQQHRLDLARVAGPFGLGGHPGHAHAQEAEGPEDHVDHDGAERDSGQRGGIAGPPDHRGVDQPDQRHGRLAEHDRPGLSEDRATGERRGHARPDRQRRPPR